MAKYEDPNQLDYRNGGDTVDDFAQKYMRTIAYVFKALNDLRTPTGNTAGVEPEPYMWRVADNKLYIRNADNTDYVLLGDISPNFGFRQSVNDRFLTTADLEGEGAVVTRNEAGKVEGDITGSPGKIAGKTIDVTPSADNDVIAYDATQQKWVKKTLNDYLKKQGDAGWDEMVDEVADQVIEDITPIIFNFWYLDEDGYLVPLVGSTEGGLPSIHGMVGDYEQITARGVEVAGNVSATGNVTTGMLTTPQANVTTLTANAVNAQSVVADELLVKKLLNENFFSTDYNTIVFTSPTTNKKSRVHYVIIPSGYKPKLKLAKDAINNVDNFCNMTCESKATVAINAGLFNTSTNETHGAIVQDSTLLRTNDIYNTEDSNGLYILYSKNGVLNAVKAKDTSDSALMALNPDWAVQGWYPVVLNGVLLQEHTATNDLHPRSFIGQDENGNYIVGAFDGRSFESAGAIMKDMYDFCLSVNFTPYFLYNLDGGGSSHFSLCGVKVNDYIEHSYRKVANMIYFNADNAIEDSVYEEVKNSELERALENTQYGDCAVIPRVMEVAGITSDNATAGFSIYKKTADTENGGYKYPRELKVGKDLSQGFIYIASTDGDLLKLYDSGNVKFSGSKQLDFKDTTIKSWGDLLLTNDDYTISYDGKENYKYIAIFEVAGCMITKTFYGYGLEKNFGGGSYAIDVINPTNGNINCIKITGAGATKNISIKKAYGSDNVYLKFLASFGCS